MNYTSFKDPDARVVKHGNTYYRKIHKSYLNEFQGVESSGLFRELNKQGLLISHEISNDIPITNEFPLVILPEQLPYLVLPFEWTATMWKEAIEAYLKINLQALKFGYVLKDATPYNFTLVGGKMCLFDSSSFIAFKNGDFWKAYRQFCEEFLGPYLLIHYKGTEWSKLTMAAIHGLPLLFISKNLPLKSLFNLTALFHVHLHKNFSNKKVRESPDLQNSKGFTNESLAKLLQSISLGLPKLNEKKEGHWKDYYVDFLESETYLPFKKEKIEQFLKDYPVNSVTDLGANTGEFSLLAADYTEKVLAIEGDANCVDMIRKMASNQYKNNVCVAMVDLSQVSPSLGNNLKEYASLFERGSSEMVFGLALIHHLAITYSFSFEQILELFASFSKKYLVVEFVPKEDEKVQILLKNRGRNFDEYSIENFEMAIELGFRVLEKMKIPTSERILYLLEKI